MYPILFSVFGINIYASPVFLILALGVGVMVGYREAERLGYTRADYNIYWISAIPIALLLAILNSILFGAGLRGLLDVIRSPGGFASNGFVSFGAVIGLLAWGFILAKIRKLPADSVMDGTATILPLMLGIYRVGCILNGCCYGRETDNLAGLYLPDQFGVWTERYPTQLLLLVFDFGLFIILWNLRTRKLQIGTLTLIFLVAFSAFRLLVDGLRDLPDVYWMFNLHQLTSLAMLLITLYFIFEFRLGSRDSSK